MTRPHFYCNLNAMNALLSMEFPEDHDGMDISVDFIEAPFWFLLTSDATTWTMKTMQRGEIYMHDENMITELGTLTIDKLTGEGDGTATDEVLAENAGMFFRGLRNLCFYALDHDLASMFEGLDPDECGLLLDVDGDELSCRLVSGKERPDLMCSTLFGGYSMMRPYMDDFWERSEVDFMSLEEKIEAAEEGNEYVMEQLALEYLNGSDEVDQDPAQAAHWFAELADLGDVAAMFNLGLFYAKGFGVERSFEQAAYWLNEAAAFGDEDAPAMIEKLEKAAASQKLAEAGDAQAQADLAATYMFLGGSLDQAGPKNDYALALDLAQKSAEQNNGDGIWTLALAYEHGRGVEENTAKAVELYERGAELGHAPSQHSLACYYFRGDFLEQDTRKAFLLCLKAAEQGYGLAMADVGRCYQFGNGVMGNMKTAVEWYEKSLEVLPDPELARKTEFFKMMGEADESWGEDYYGDYDPDEDER